MKIKNQKTNEVKKRKEMTKYVEKMLGVDKKNEQLYEEEIGVVGVDSGQILICDPCYIDSQWKEEEYDFPIKINVETGEEIKGFINWEDEFKKGMTYNQAREKGLIKEETPKPKNNFSYNACCQKTAKELGGQLNYELGHAGVGVVTSSGYGDGCYPVIATIDKSTGRVKSIRVEFF